MSYHDSFRKVLRQINTLTDNRTFELLFPLQYLDIKIREISETSIHTLQQRWPSASAGEPYALKG